MPPDEAEATMARKPVWGIHQGIVEERIDPDQLGRLKVRVVSVLAKPRLAGRALASPSRTAAPRRSIRPHRHANLDSIRRRRHEYADLARVSIDEVMIQNRAP